jgi:hypothetical protein
MIRMTWSIILLSFICATFEHLQKQTQASSTVHHQLLKKILNKKKCRLIFFWLSGASLLSFIELVLLQKEYTRIALAAFHPLCIYERFNILHSWIMKPIFPDYPLTNWKDLVDEHSDKMKFHVFKKLYFLSFISGFGRWIYFLRPYKSNNL